MDKKTRGGVQKAVDFVTFPLRAVMPFRVGQHKKWGLSSRASERFDYAAKEIEGYTLDVGCGPYNRFVNEYLGGHGLGIDVVHYEGLDEEQVLEDLTRLPFPDAAFDSVSLIAVLHHIPKPLRKAELAEMYRVLKPGGQLVLTMTTPLAAWLIHRVTRVHARFLGVQYDIDLLREMKEDEEDFVTEKEVRKLSAGAGFSSMNRKYFLTQWGLNRLFVIRKGLR